MEKKELTEQIGILNKKILEANKELEESQLNVKRKRIEIKKYKNEIKGIQLELEELEIEKWKVNKKQSKRFLNNRFITGKYKDNESYYSQDKKISNLDNIYASYMEKKLLPYND